MVKLAPIRVNHFDSGFWLVPPASHIFAPRWRASVTKRYASVGQLIQQEHLVLGAYYFSFNGDPDCRLFNQVQHHSDLNVTLSAQTIQILQSNQPVRLEIISNRVWLELNHQSLKFIQAGYCFFVDCQYFRDLILHYERRQFRPPYIFTWHKTEFRLLK